jgi:uncharacterized protein (TIGR02452 family)
MTKNQGHSPLRSKLIDVAQETLDIISKGGYNDEKRWYPIHEAKSDYLSSYDLETLRDKADPSLRSSGKTPKITVTAETTSSALRRMAKEGAEDRVCGLNFASAKHPGGGFLSGAVAQEEDLCRVSTLYPTLAKELEYYQRNRREPTELYNDGIILSRGVAFFRDEFFSLLDGGPVYVNILTVPAPNKRALIEKAIKEGTDPVIAKHPVTGADVTGIGIDVTHAIHRRVHNMLHVAELYHQRRLVLGAWGCGIFGNDPLEVASSFRMAIPEFLGAFDEICFAIYDTSETKHVLRTFEKVFDTVRHHPQE